MKNTLLTMAFLAVGSLLLISAPSSAERPIGACGCYNMAAGFCYKGPPGVLNRCAPPKKVGICGCVVENKDGGHCGAAGGFNPCLDQEYADTHRYE